MKDVNDILAKRLKMLEKPFSRDWLSDFSFLWNSFKQTPAPVRSSLRLQKKKKRPTHQL